MLFTVDGILASLRQPEAAGYFRVDDLELNGLGDFSEPILEINQHPYSVTYFYMTCGSLTLLSVADTGSGLISVGPFPPTKWLLHIKVCAFMLAVPKLLRLHAIIHRLHLAGSICGLGNGMKNTLFVGSFLNLRLSELHSPKQQCFVTIFCLFLLHFHFELTPKIKFARRLVNKTSCYHTKSYER